MKILNEAKDHSVDVKQLRQDAYHANSNIFDIVLEEQQSSYEFTLPLDLRRTSLIQENHNLTKRQLDCLLYLVKGLTIKQIGCELMLSPKTVEHYLDAVKTKLNCHTRSELIEKAFQFNDVRKYL